MGLFEVEQSMRLSMMVFVGIAEYMRMVFMAVIKQVKRVRKAIVVYL